MNATETAALLAVIATYDSRKYAEPEVIAWHKAIGDLPFPQCRDAVVKHYATETDWIKPAHIRRIINAAWNDTSMRALPAIPDDAKPMPSWFRQRVAEMWKMPDFNREPTP